MIEELECNNKHFQKNKAEKQMIIYRSLWKELKDKIGPGRKE